MHQMVVWPFRGTLTARKSGQTGIPRGMTLCISTQVGQLARKEHYRGGLRGPDGQQIDHEPVTHPHSKESQQPLGLR